MSGKHILGKAHDLGVEVTAVTDFLGREWGRHTVSASPAFYEWQFKRAPLSEGRDHNVVLLDGERRVQGFLGVIPRTVFLNRETVKGLELTTWVVARGLRGRGMAPRMLRFAMEDCDLIMGTGPTNVSLPVLARLGWRHQRYLPRYVRVLNPAKVIAASEIGVLGMKEIRRHAKRPKATGYRVEEVGLEQGAPEAEGLPARFNAGTRSPEYLRWRYAEHPVFSYQGYRIERHGQSALIVVRIDRAAELTVIHVMELLGDFELFDSAVSFIDVLGGEVEADFADFSCTTDRINHLFWRRGWFSMLDDHWVQVPHLLHPVTLCQPPTMALVLWARENQASFLDWSRLYLTKGDIDLDRPNQAYLEQHGGL